MLPNLAHRPSHTGSQNSQLPTPLLFPPPRGLAPSLPSNGRKELLTWQKSFSIHTDKRDGSPNFTLFVLSQTNVGLNLQYFFFFLTS